MSDGLWLRAIALALRGPIQTLIRESIGRNRQFAKGRCFFISRIIEVYSGHASGFHADGFRKGTEAFVPRLKRVGPCRNFIDVECSSHVAHGEIRIADDSDVRVHPIVNVTFDVKHDFFSFRFPIVYVAGRRLADVESLIFPGQRVGVMQECVAVFDLQSLAQPDAQNPGIEYAPALVERDRLNGDRRLRNISFQVYENIGETTIRRGDNILLEYALTGARLGAHRIDSHPNEGVPRQLTTEMNVAFYGSCSRLGTGLTGHRQRNKECEENSTHHWL